MPPQKMHSAPRSTLGIIVGTALLLTLSGCSALTPGDNPLDVDGSAGDDTPFEQRQTAEDYAAIVPPAILHLQEQLTQAGSGPWERGKTRYQFDIDQCKKENGKESHNIRITGAESGPVPVETMVQLSTEVFAPLGYRMSVTEYDGTDITWVDWRNGGYIWLSVQPELIGLSGNSECRPGSDFHGTRAKLRALMPLPTETPGNTSAPTPTKERQHPARPRKHLPPVIP